MEASGNKPLWVAPPSGPEAPGTPGDLARDARFLYICIASNSWGRVPILSPSQWAMQLKEEG